MFGCVCDTQGSAVGGRVSAVVRQHGDSARRDTRGGRGVLSGTETPAHVHYVSLFIITAPLRAV